LACARNSPPKQLRRVELLEEIAREYREQVEQEKIPSGL
jgi:hypothetical protein